MRSASSILTMPSLQWPNLRNARTPAMCKWESGLRASRWLCGSRSDEAKTHFLWADWPHLPFVTCWWAEWPCRNGWSQQGVPPSPTPLSSSTLARGRPGTPPSPAPSWWNLPTHPPFRPQPWDGPRGLVSLAHPPHGPTFPSPIAQKQRGRGAAQSETLASSPPCSEGGTRCSALGSDRGTLGPACHMFRDELRSGEQACPAGFLAPGTQADQRDELPKVVGEEEAARPLGLGLYGPLLALGCGLVRGAGGGNKREVGCSQEEPGCQPARMGLL